MILCCDTSGNVQNVLLTYGTEKCGYDGYDRYDRYDISEEPWKVRYDSERPVGDYERGLRIVRILLKRHIGEFSVYNEYYNNECNSNGSFRQCLFKLLKVIFRIVVALLAKHPGTDTSIIPLCATCKFSNMRCPGCDCAIMKPRPEKLMSLKQGVSIDQLASSIPRLLAHTKGRVSI